MGKISKSSRLPLWAVLYHKTTIMVPYPVNPRKGVCVACKRTIKAGQIKTTQLHHHKYAYTTAKVKKNPILALENTSEYCYACHQIADALRAITFLKDQNLWRVSKVAMSLPDWMQEKFGIVCRQYLAQRSRKPRVLPDFFLKNRKL